MYTFAQKIYTIAWHAHVRVNIFFYPLTFFSYFSSLTLNFIFDIFYVSHILSWAFLAFRVAKKYFTHEKKEKIWLFYKFINNIYFLPSLKCFFEQIRKDRKFTSGALKNNYFHIRDRSDYPQKWFKVFRVEIIRSGKRWSEMVKKKYILQCYYERKFLLRVYGKH